MRPASLKKYQAILNIGLQKSKQQVRPVYRDIRYADPKHIVMVDVIHNEINTKADVLCIDGDREHVRPLKEPEEIREPVKVRIPRDYLKAIIDNVAPGGDVLLTAGTDCVLKIEALLDDETEIRAWIAPRIENE